MKYFCLPKNAFIRTYDNYGYIIHQFNKKEFRFNSIGAVFLNQIKRDIGNIDESVNNMCVFFEEVDYHTLNHDFREFLSFLESNDLILLADSKVELLRKNKSYLNSPFHSNRIELNNSFDIESELENVDNTVAERFQFDPLKFTFHIELTTKCNERCIHCYIPNNEKLNGDFLDFEVIKKVLDEVSAANVLNVTFSGGEILMHQELIDILKYAREKDFIITLFSNLISLNEKHVNLLKEINPKLVQVTLYSTKENEHDSITQVKGSCFKTKRSIEKLVANNIPIEIACPIMKGNYKSYVALASYAQSKNLKLNTDYNIIAQSDFDQQNLSVSLSLSEFEEHLQDILFVNKLYGISTEKEKLDSIKIKELNSNVCGAGSDRICLTSKGEYIPCPAWKNYKVGDARKSSFLDVMLNSQENKYLRTVKNRSFTKCLNCDVSEYCNICMEKNFNESGGDIYYINEEYCNYIKSYKRILRSNRSITIESFNQES